MLEKTKMVDYLMEMKGELGESSEHLGMFNIYRGVVIRSPGDFVSDLITTAATLLIIIFFNPNFF